MIAKLEKFCGCLAVCTLVACSNGPQVVGSKFVKTATVSAAGATIVVSNSDDSTLAGTTITIPANALATPTTISIGLSSTSVAPSDAHAEGPVVDFEPSGTVFAVPVTVAIPVTSSSAALFIEAVEANGAASQIAVQSVTNGLATFQIKGFTNYGGCSAGNDGGIASCRTDSDCASGQECVNAVCVAATNTCDGGLNPGDICATDADCVCAGLVCVSGHCGSAPANDGGVTDGGTLSCASDSDCPACDVCVSGECFASDELCNADGGVVANDGGCGVDSVVCDATTGISTDLNADPANCGSCGDRCASGVCACGVCTASGCSSNSDCPTGEVCTGGICSAVANDAGTPVSDGGTLACSTNSDCGQCSECVSGQCFFSDQLCAPDGGTNDGGINPGGTCSTDSDCFSGEVCIGGVCTTSGSDGGCAADPAVCNGVRTDLSDDNNNCGACGSICAVGTTCSCGACGS